LRSSTQGKAEYTMEFAKYAPASSDLTEQLAKEYAEKKAAGNK
jgi:elongation factor G